MDLPVANVDHAAVFYTDVMGFEIISTDDNLIRSITLGRPDVKFRIAENGGDPSQDGCAFEVDNLEHLLAEFKENGFEKDHSDIKMEKNDGVEWKVFYVVAPDGLCYWIGERISS
jgi:catechol 2,3-dioxygenase-like lactoylglutathione lyase family enzyme